MLSYEKYRQIQADLLEHLQDKENRKEALFLMIGRIQ